MYAGVAVDAAIYQVDRVYTYAVPSGMVLQPGMRVSVPFGGGNRTTEGIVLSLSETPPEQVKAISYKEILYQLDTEPVLDGAMLKLAGFMRERYFCTFYDAVKAILPAGLWLRVSRVYTRLPGCPERLEEDIDAFKLLQEIDHLGGTVSEAALLKSFGPSVAEPLQRLLQKGFLKADRELEHKNSDRTEVIWSLGISPEEAMEEAAAKKRRAPVQAAVLEMLAVMGVVSGKELCYFSGATSDTLKRLEKKGILVKGSVEVFRPAYQPSLAEPEPITLSSEQQAVYNGLSAELTSKHPSVSLLYGVTGSGKTAVYLRLIQDCLDLGKSAVLLVPEIALTPQLLQKLSAHFGKQVAVLHSRLPAGARYDEWKRIRSGKANVVVGTRSAVFAPVQNPGLFIVDEEHEHTYKSENTPRYHAREIAIYRGHYGRFPVLLGSATPALETMYRAKGGVYRLYTLKTRYGMASLPQTEIIDMKEELRSGNSSMLSATLRAAIKSQGQQQTILFLNRRGSSRMVVCVDCGEIPECPNCSVKLTYHRDNERLMCHYCGYSELYQSHCPSCGGHRKQVGFGTQSVQADLQALLPGREILRMDADTVTATNTHEDILERFRKENAPVLLGTQMITKGLNFPNVTLVGVLDADASLYMDSFRASETAFAMITQVIGRSGRSLYPGRAMVQTMTPDNEVIRLAAAQDYDAFYELELPIRKLQLCPPFADRFLITFSGTEAEPVQLAAVAFRKNLEKALRRQNSPAQLLGPAPAPVVRLCGRYRYRLTLSAANTREIRQLLEHLLRNPAKEYKKIGVYIDVNPYE